MESYSRPAYVFLIDTQLLETEYLEDSTNFTILYQGNNQVRALARADGCRIVSYLTCRCPLYFVRHNTHIFKLPLEAKYVFNWNLHFVKLRYPWKCLRLRLTSNSCSNELDHYGAERLQGEWAYQVLVKSTCGYYKYCASAGVCIMSRCMLCGV